MERSDIRCEKNKTRELIDNNQLYKYKNTSIISTKKIMAYMLQVRKSKENKNINLMELKELPDEQKNHTRS